MFDTKSGHSQQQKNSQKQKKQHFYCCSSSQSHSKLFNTEQKNSHLTASLRWPLVHLYVLEFRVHIFVK